MATRPRPASSTGTRANAAIGISLLTPRPRCFTVLIGLPGRPNADVVADALAAKIVELPQQLRRSLTWDQGKEMAEHAGFSIDSGLPVYFCDPRSPRQRGTNENINGLLRQLSGAARCSAG
jgi:IS30 family transposase